MTTKTSPEFDPKADFIEQNAKRLGSERRAGLIYGYGVYSIAHWLDDEHDSLQVHTEGANHIEVITENILIGQRARSFDLKGFFSWVESEGTEVYDNQHWDEDED